MAFNTTNLSAAPLGGISNYIWDYSTSDNLSTVSGANYFDTSTGNSPLRVGDLIRITASDGKRIIYIDTVGHDGTGVQKGTLAANVSSF